MTARERAEALAFYVKEETSEWTGHMIPRFKQEIEAAEREAWNAAIAAAAQEAIQSTDTRANLAASIRKLNK